MDSWFLAPPLSANIAAGVSTPSINSKTFPNRSAIIRVPIARYIAAITITPEANKMNLVPLGTIVAALVFAFIGILVFIVAFIVMDKLTPYHLWKEIVQEHNMALAILVGAMSIGICIIIAAAIPLLMGIVRDRYQFRDVIAHVLTFDYLGALAASLLFPILFVPRLGLVRSAMLFGLINAGVALWSTFLFAN